jgi:hypothetical protein
MQNIREQMAISLERMKELEEQVKLIPVLQVSGEGGHCETQHKISQLTFPSMLAVLQFGNHLCPTFRHGKPTEEVPATILPLTFNGQGAEACGWRGVRQPWW